MSSTSFIKNLLATESPMCWFFCLFVLDVHRMDDTKIGVTFRIDAKEDTVRFFTLGNWNYTFKRHLNKIENFTNTIVDSRSWTGGSNYSLFVFKKWFKILFVNRYGTQLWNKHFNNHNKLSSGPRFFACWLPWRASLFASNFQIPIQIWQLKIPRMMTLRTSSGIVLRFCTLFPCVLELTFFSSF